MLLFSWIKGSGINAPGVLYGWGKKKSTVALLQCLQKNYASEIGHENF